MVNKKFSIVVTVLIGFLVCSTAYSQTETINSVRLAIKAGDSNSLVKFFDSVVELKTDSEEGAYSKNQAEFVLKNFFKKHTPVNFTYNHEGSSPGGAKYTIGTYQCESASFRVYMKLKSSGNTYVIDTLDFSKE